MTLFKLCSTKQKIMGKICISVYKQEHFQTNSATHSVNTRNKTQLHGPTANLSCFQNSAHYERIKIFNSLPSSRTSLANKKGTIKVSLKRYLITHTPFTLLMYF
jgi:hypothetical protein